MKIMVRLGVLFYMVITLFLGCFIALFALNLIPFQEVTGILSVIYYDQNIRGISGIVAVLILAMNHLFARAISGNQERGKTIAFDNPAGRVTVSLTALEDLIRRVISKVPEVREARSSISAGKKGFVIKSRLVLNTEVNIPEMTARVQEIVKRKVQDTIGVEEAIVVRVDIVKIISSKSVIKESKKKDESEQSPEPTVPFQGYRP